MKLRGGTWLTTQPTLPCHIAKTTENIRVHDASMTNAFTRATERLAGAFCVCYRSRWPCGSFFRRILRERGVLQLLPACRLPSVKTRPGGALQLSGSYILPMKMHAPVWLRAGCTCSTRVCCAQLLAGVMLLVCAEVILCVVVPGMRYMFCAGIG